MKQIIRYSLFFIAVLLLATSCKKSVPKQTKYIPKDAMFVVDINWKSLSEKAAKGNINWDSLFKSISAPQADSSIAEAKKKFDEFVKSGIDFENNVFFYLKMGGSMVSGQSVSGAVIAAIKDAAQFEAYLKKQPGVGEVKKGSNYSYATLNESVLVGWNSDIAILAGAGSKQGQGNTSEQVLSTLFSQKEEETVSAIPEFRELMNEKGDMLFWSNSSNVLNSVPLLGLTKASDLLKDSYSSGTINFEDGKVTSDFKSYSGKDLAAIWKKYAGPTTDMNLVNKYPSPVSGFAVFSFNPAVITELIKFAGVESTANQFLEKSGFTLDDIIKSFKGDFAIVFSDLGITEKEYDYEGKMIKTKVPSAKLVFNAAIGDKASYDKIMSKLAEAELVEMKNGQYVPKGMEGMIGWNMDGKNLVIATDSSLVTSYLAGKGNAAIPADIAEKSKNKCFSLYVDINKILQAMPADSSYQSTMDAAKATFNKVISTAENYNGNYVASNLELTTMNDKENSLVTLVKFFASVSEKLQKEGKRLERSGMDEDADSTELEEPPMPSK